MAQITVKAKIDGGVHRKYGAIIAGQTYPIDEEDFGAELFERPSPEWLSPHEQKDKERAEAEGIPVGGFDPPAKVEEPPALQPAPKKTVKNVEEVNDNAN